MRILPTIAVAILMLGAPLGASAQDKDTTYTLSYRGHNVWVHVDDMAPLNKLSSFAKDENIQDFNFYLPEDLKDNALYIERLSVIRDILTKRLGTKDISLTQQGTHTQDNAITIRPH